MPQAKMGRCGGLIGIVQEKPAKVFPAHTLFLADGGKNSQPPPTREARFEFEVRQGSRKSPEAVRGIPGSEFAPRCPL